MPIIITHQDNVPVVFAQLTRTQRSKAGYYIQLRKFLDTLIRHIPVDTGELQRSMKVRPEIVFGRPIRLHISLHTDYAFELNKYDGRYGNYDQYLKRAAQAGLRFLYDPRGVIGSYSKRRSYVRIDFLTKKEATKRYGARALRPPAELRQQRLREVAGATRRVGRAARVAARRARGR